MDRAQIQFCSNIIFNLASLAESSRKLKLESIADDLETLADRVEEKLKQEIESRGHA